MSYTLPNEIEKAIKNNTLVFFIGSGTSVPLGFPDWDDLVIEILGELSIREPVLASFIPLLKEKQMTSIGILEYIKNKKPEIYKIIKKRFLVDIEEEKLNRHKNLWGITSKIITTNYDKALETASPNKITPIVYTQPYEVSQLTKNAQYLLKMHGSIEDVENCILFEEDYKKLYDGGEKSVLFQLKKIFSDYTILFLGFSLQDTYVCHIFEHMNKVFHGYINRHFVISTNDDDFSDYSTDILKIENWGDALDEILDEMLKLKPPKNSAIEETTVTLPEVALDNGIKETSKVKIAILLASPIDKPYEFSFTELTKNFENLDLSIRCHYLSLEVVQELEGYDYFVIFSQVFKDKLCIEDEYFKSTFVSLKTLETYIHCKSLKAIFCFTNDDID